MHHVMIDLETMGNTTLSAVIQIGACYFDINTGEIGTTLKLNVCLDSELKSGFSASADTIKWWMKQSSETQEFFTENKGIKSENAFMTFRRYLDHAKYIWSHATFDFVIVQYHFETHGINPLHFRSARDIRTIFHLANFKHRNSGIKREGLHHNALSDAIYQSKCVSQAYNKLISNK